MKYFFRSFGKLSDCVPLAYSSNAGISNLSYELPMKNILIVTKPNCKNTKLAQSQLITHISSQYPLINLISETVQDQKTLVVDDRAELERVVDLIITLGGDGTILHASSLFGNKVAPILAFSMGSLGFLSPFAFSDFKNVVDRVLHQEVPVLQRSRLKSWIEDTNTGACTSSKFEAMNEITVHRGWKTHLGKIDCYVDDELLTDAVADGLIVATPTGSTAYSLSAGGPIVHPQLPSMILTPICPRSLSFRSLVLPPQMVIKMKLSAEAKGNADVAVDGKSVFTLKHGVLLHIKTSRHTIPFFQQIGPTDWVDGITKTLRWNQRFFNSNQSK